MKYVILIQLSFLLSISYSQNSSNIKLLSHWTDTSLLKGAENAIFSDVWGFNVKGSNYIATGSTEGTHILQIENKTWKEIDFSPGKFSSLQVQHRDYKTYKNYLYAVCDEGMSSLQIFDLNFLPDSIHKIYDSNEFFQICHNIVIDTLNAKLYACGTNGFGMTILDLTNPVIPNLNYEFTTVNYVHDCFVNNDTAYLNCGPDGLHILDFNSLPPQYLGVLDAYPDQGYNHSGYLSENKKKYLFVDESTGKKVKICNSESLQDIQIESVYGTKNYKNSVAHNIQIESDFAFISYYNEGLRIVDIKSKTPKEIGFYDTFPQETNYKLNGAWGVYVFKTEELIVISDRQNGLFLFEFPMQLYRNIEDQSVVSSSPFINEYSKLIYPSDSDKLYFTIYTSNGKTAYYKESINDWINIPLDLSSGAYIYAIQNEFFDVVSQGKFIIAN